MTPQEARDRIEKIRNLMNDPEAAHIEEDNLYLAALRTIAEGRADDPGALAAEAIKANDLDFSRWYA